MGRDRGIWKTKCVSTSRRTGEPCQAWAMEGQTVCSVHGGKAKVKRQAGARRMADLEVERQLARLLPGVDIADVEHPEAKLRETTGTLDAMARALGTALMNVGALDDVDAIDKHAKSLDRMQSLLRDIGNASATLMQHGSAGGAGEDDEDERTGLEKLTDLLEELEERRNINMTACAACHGEGWVPRFVATDDHSDVVTGVVVEATDTVGESDAG